MNTRVCLSIAALLSQSVLATDTEWTHFLTARSAVGLADSSQRMLDLSWQAEAQWRFADGARLTGLTRLRFQSETGLRPTDMERSSFDPISVPIRIGNNSELALRELYYQRELDDGYLTLGKQQVVWGKTDGLKVLDVVNPQSFKEFILEDFEQSRIPQWLINAERPLGDWTAQLLWIPDRSYHATAKPGAHYAFTSPRLIPQTEAGTTAHLKAAQRPDDLLGDSDAGLRLTSFIDGWDLSFNYLYQYHNQAALHLRQLSATEVEITPRYHRTHVVGGSFSRALGDWVNRGEGGYFSDRYFVSNAGDRTANSPELSYVIGLDWSGLDDTFISAQLFQSWLPDYSPNITRPRLDTSVTLLARKDFWNDTLSAEVLWIANRHDGDGLLRPKLSYDVSDGVRAWLGLDIFYGDAKGQFGQFDNKDRILLGIEFGF